MDKLTKNEIKKLKLATKDVLSGLPGTWFSCLAVKHYLGNKFMVRYADFVGASLDRASLILVLPGSQGSHLENSKLTLSQMTTARSLSILLFIEANK